MAQPPHDPRPWPPEDPQISTVDPALEAEQAMVFACVVVFLLGVFVGSVGTIVTWWVWHQLHT